MKNILFLSFFIFSLNAQVSDLILQADNEALKLFDNKKALATLEAALKVEPNNAEILWRISRAYVDIGEHLPSNNENQKEQQLKYYQNSLSFANRAIANSSNNKILKSNSLTRRAISNGRVALFKGIWESLDLVKNVKDDCLEAIKLDNQNEAAFYVLARTHAKVCEKSKFIRIPLGLGWANLDESIKYFKKAIELRPNFMMYRLDYARTLIETENFYEAKIQLLKIPTLPFEDEDDEKHKKESAELLKKIN